MPTPDLIVAADVTGMWPAFGSLASGEQASLLTSASRMFEEECDRVFSSVTYIERHETGRVRSIYTRQKPITNIIRIATDFGTVMTVANASAAIQRAAVGYTSTGMPEDYPAFTGLTLTGISSGVPITPISLPFSTYPTIGGLVNQIGALGNGWSATVAMGVPNITGGNFSNWPSTDLVGDMGQQGCSVLACELKAYTRDLDYACDPDMSRRGVIAIFEGRPDGYRYPDRRYGPSSYGGLTGIAGGCDPRIGSVLVSYTAGYAQANMPGDIKRACAGIAKFIYESGKFSTFQSETVGEWSRSLKEWKRGLPDWILNTIDNHARKEIYAGGI